MQSTPLYVDRKENQLMDEQTNSVITTMQTTALLLRADALLRAHYYLKPVEGASDEYWNFHILARDLNTHLYNLGVVEYPAFEL